jgi:hypothetical protein
MTKQAHMRRDLAFLTAGGHRAQRWKCGIALIYGLVGLATFPALAGPLVNTQEGADPRRGTSKAATVAVETNPQDDKTGSRDPERVDESFQPKGIELGKFLLLPLLETEGRYNSNLFALRNNPKSDFITRLSPEIQLRSRFSEHAVNITAKAEKLWMSRFHSDNQVNGQLNVDSRYDFDRDWEGTGGIDIAHNHEDRGSPDEAGGKKPTPADSYAMVLGSKRRVDKYTFSGNVQVTRRVYGDVSTSSGTMIHNGDRDRLEVVGTGRASYEIFPGYSAIVELQGNDRRYDSEFDDNGFKRSSRGWQAATGIGVDITQLIRGDFVVGYLHQNYDDARYSDPHGLAFRAVFNWTPSRMTVVVPSFERSVQETTLLNASSIVRNNVSLVVRHEYSRNIVLTGVGSVSRDEFEGIGRSDWTYEGRGRVVWALAPEYYVGGEASYRKRTSSTASAEYDQYVMLLRFGLRM